ncbi:RagB/SusD family nutrient uptake outer membrane protein [Maribellus sp. CM-23]|uniref:RagB/SusD family nutrient uptake outer membrane protein n=1 Tax=Maribellus sp. CM-23 TaxID=2781026 RepID=UPI001F44A252|nr:RagB/SusD family nutrient uptake outer membrane protein [Maribellus sp. CM-23]MCE4564680.1 RagB/SusD family nutrient uptake outer membrane protein [Maribellus sp. CM-23]
MKKILYTILACAVLWACNMEEIPEAQISVEPVFGSETGLEMYTNSFYEVLPTRTTQYTNSYYIAVNSVIKYLTENGFSAQESSGWNWRTLRNINYFIANCDNESVPVATRNNYLGIARFFRAYFYFDMMKRFGDLPWVGHPLDVNDPLLYSARDSRALIADSIKADLNFAIAHISTEKDATCSTITKTVAAALKSRVCLWEGTYRKYQSEAGLQSTANQWLQEAADAAQIVMDEGYSLYTGGGVENSYRALFVAKTPLSSEVLYAVTFDSDLGVVHSGNRQWTSVTFGSCPSLVRPFVHTYLKLDGTPFTNDADYATKSFVEECENRDYRLSQTIRTPGFTRVSGGAVVPTAPDYAYAITGYQTSKFTLDDTQYDNVDVCDNNVILFRYAEVLLNYAEAKAELGTLSDGDWAQTVGALRARAGITGGLTTKPKTVDPYLQGEFFPGITNPEILEIRRERGIELSFEGFEWSDVCRWGIGEQLTKDWEGIYIPEFEVPYDMNSDGKLDVCFTKQLNPTDKVAGVYYLYVGEKLANGANNNSQIADDGHTLVFMKDQKRTWHNKLYFYPIPANDLVMNPNLGQNPGWE